MARRRRLAVVVFAALAGIALGLIDSSPGFDDTGITAGGLIAAGAVSGLLDGSGAIGWATLYALLLAAWIFTLERAASPSAAAALVFALIGSVGAALLLHLRGTSVDGT